MLELFTTNVKRIIDSDDAKASIFLLIDLRENFEILKFYESRGQNKSNIKKTKKLWSVK